MFEDEALGEFNDNGDDVGFSFEELERLEAEKSSRALKELDLKLYSDVAPTIDPEVADIEDRSPRYYSAGYDANYECVEDKEILQWRRTFPYLHVTGTSICRDSKEATLSFDCLPPSVNMNTFREDGSYVCDETLVVVGKAVTLHPVRLGNTPVESEELVEEHGILEEIIAIDHSSLPSSENVEPPDLNEANLCSDPSDTQRDEVVSGLFSMVWPDVVNGMKPLISKVLKLAEDTNFDFDDYRRSNLEDMEVISGKKRPAENDGFDFNDDDEW